MNNEVQPADLSQPATAGFCRLVAGVAIALTLSTAQAHSFELHQHDVANHGFAQVGVLTQREGHVVKHAQVGEQGTKLKQHAHAPAGRIQLRGVHPGDVLAGTLARGAMEKHLSALSAVLPADQAKHGGFSAS